MRRLPTQAFEMSETARPWHGDRLAPESVTEAGPPERQVDAYKQAYLEGFDAGYADGDGEARKALQAAQEDARAASQKAEAEQQYWRDQLLALTRQFADAQASQLKQMEALAITVAYAAVCRILGRKHAEHSLMPAVCQETIASLRTKVSVLRVASSDAAQLHDAKLPVEITVDPTFKPGECVLDTGLGELDAGMETQMQELLQSLLRTLRNGGSE